MDMDTRYKMLVFTFLFVLFCYVWPNPPDDVGVSVLGRQVETRDTVITRHVRWMLQ